MRYMNKLIAKIKAFKHKEIALAVIAVLVMLLIYFSTFAPKKESDATSSAENYCSAMCKSIEAAVERMGAGNAEVVIAWSSSVEIVVEKNLTTNGSSSSEQVAQSGGSPIVLKEIYPRAIGVMIVCKGGNNAKVRIDIIMAVSTLLDISAEKVLVFGTNK